MGIDSRFIDHVAYPTPWIQTGSAPLGLKCGSRADFNSTGSASENYHLIHPKKPPSATSPATPSAVALGPKRIIGNSPDRKLQLHHTLRVPTPLAPLHPAKRLHPHPRLRPQMKLIPPINHCSPP
ncbi:hypothetical protein N9891_01595 [bacterium]|nr:hypothetical protein [bacterium]